ncbi:aspartate carbamoyltransferase [Anaerococcus sp. AGMB00486]|uniref:Aspartate carbamoyltransferase n=2 Tax=Anaerococcus TaxID=165779 RepID=A0ABX2N7I4_9FIRM|nr:MULTISPECIES: aspartate carbamoyltransferase [Anaerococcus]MDY3007357.1 aspartate carbamoyltransferase [Anaerococcus porci]MSS76969.1 aspartate carbamoyltransferase [Anaerococcus porci]NVF10544.1 aspartate carbamoyltransferase [Anaerococcus faecalis]
MLKIKNLLSAEDLYKDDLLEVIDLAEDIVKSPSDFSDYCNGKLLGTLFFEPSTRTRLSFESAMLRLGGSVVGFSNAASSSQSKGESLQDTIKTVSQYADIIAMRHPQEGAAKLASEVSDCPIINAGDGGHQHPTQTLTDILTIKTYKNKLEGLRIGLCGDLKYGRTVHSLLKVLTMFDNNEYVLISPEELKLPNYIKKSVFEKHNIEFEERRSLDDSINDLDILYMTRIQKERFFSDNQYTRLKDSYVLNKEKLKDVKKDLAILHPLPRVNEIDTDVDNDPRALYFKQVKCGMYARMALIIKLLEGRDA